MLPTSSKDQIGKSIFADSIPFMEDRDAVDLEMQDQLQLALATYRQADESNKEHARAEYLALLRAFSMRVVR